MHFSYGRREDKRKTSLTTQMLCFCFPNAWTWDCLDSSSMSPLIHLLEAVASWKEHKLWDQRDQNLNPISTIKHLFNFGQFFLTYLWNFIADKTLNTHKYQAACWGYFRYLRYLNQLTSIKTNVAKMMHTVTDKYQQSVPYTPSSWQPYRALCPTNEPRKKVNSCCESLKTNSEQIKQLRGKYFENGSTVYTLTAGIILTL